MLLSMTSNRLDSIVQFITVILIFIFVLAVTYFTTKLTAGIQKGRMLSPNMELIEAFRIAQNNYIQIVRVGEKYYSIVVCKDTVTLLGEVSKEEINIPESQLGTTMSFKEILEKAKSMKQKK